MQIHIYDHATQAGQAGALLLAAQLLRKPDSVLGLATGSSPIPVYQELRRLYAAGIISFRQAVSYNLDEYVGLAPDHPCSYHRFMQEELFDHVDMRPETIHVPDGLAADPDAAAAAYDRAIEAAGGIDLQLLGIGHDGLNGLFVAFDDRVYVFRTACTAFYLEHPHAGSHQSVDEADGLQVLWTHQILIVNLNFVACLSISEDVAAAANLNTFATIGRTIGIVQTHIALS